MLVFMRMTHTPATLLYTSYRKAYYLWAKFSSHFFLLFLSQLVIVGPQMVDRPLKIYGLRQRSDKLAKITSSRSGYLQSAMDLCTFPASNQCVIKMMALTLIILSTSYMTWNLSLKLDFVDFWQHWKFDSSIEQLLKELS